MGLRLAALRAGYHPKKMPMAEQTKNDIIRETVVITTGQFMMEAITCVATIPIVIPITPPKTLNKMDSIKN